MSGTAQSTLPDPRAPQRLATAEESHDDLAFLSTLPGGHIQKRLALAAAAVSVLLFLAVAPFAKLALAPNQAFLPLYQSALVICELITAVLLFGQFEILRFRALLVLACAYLFSALMAVVHLLSFPGLFSASGLLGSGPQTTAWVYFLWHGVFPLLVIGYALLKSASNRTIPTGRTRFATLVGIAATIAVAGALTLLATAGHDVLPTIMQGNRDAPAKFAVAVATWSLCLVALFRLWRQERGSVLDLWLMVVMCVWIFDIALAAVLNAGRFDAGWYAGRIYGLMGSSFVLVVLMIENGALYAKLAVTHVTHERHLRMLHEVDLAIAAGQTPVSIAGAVVEPLRELLDVPRAIVNVFDLPAGEVEWLAAAGRRHTRVGPGVRYSIRLMGDLDALKRGEPQVVDTTTLPEGPDKKALLASGVRKYMVMPMIVGGELIGAISFGGESGRFSKAQVRIARELAAQLAIAMGQARLYGQVTEHATRLEAENAARRLAEEGVRRLNRVYAVLSGINSLTMRIHNQQALFDEACQIAVGTGDFPLVWIGVIDAKTAQIIPVASAGIEKRFLDTVPPGISTREDTPGGSSALARVVAEKRPVVSNDVESDPQIRFKKEYRECGIRSIALLPLLVAGDAVGVLALSSKEKGFFDEEELKLLVELAGDIAFAMDYIKKEEALNYLAYYDSLTGLPNRTHYLERLSRGVDAAAREKRQLVVLSGDVKHFHKINEAFGQATGDEYLRQLAARLQKHALYPENVARISGDNFAAFEPDAHDLTDVVHRVERFSKYIESQPIRIGDQDLTVRYCVGLAVYPNDGPDAETLLGNAESALKKAKSSGKSFMYYESAINARVAESLKLENKLRRALEQEQFVLHYQPKVESRGQKVQGVEALIRWNDPELGLVPPGRFIPLMEETGIIKQAGAWALGQAVADIGRWRALGLQSPRVAVNVSAIQLREKDFVGIVLDVLNGFGDNEPLLDIEITESLIMENVTQSTRALEALRGVGVHVSVDDFGTGYSSLAYLARLPINALKIDRTFIHGMTMAGEGVTIVEAIISLAHALNLSVIAEGVETEHQAEILRRLKCDLMQGYLFGKPVPWEKITTMLQRQDKSGGLAG